MSHDDFDTEPLPGLPALPPDGERVLWQGKPQWTAVARHVMHVDLVAVYFVALFAWRISSSRSADASFNETLSALAPMAITSVVAIALLVVIAWGIGRTTIYTLTSRRVILRFGIALPVTFNLPFKSITSVDVNKTAAGKTDIALRLESGTRLAYFVLWPHVRPWRLRSPEPMLRALVDGDSVAALFAEAIRSNDSSAIQNAPASIGLRLPADEARQPALVAAE